MPERLSGFARIVGPRRLIRTRFILAPYNREAGGRVESDEVVEMWRTVARGQGRDLRVGSTGSFPENDQRTIILSS